MSGTVATVVSAVAAPLAADLKSAVVAAADAHLATVTADVTKLKAAVAADLAGVAAAVPGVFAQGEHFVVAEIEKLAAFVANLKVAGIVSGVAAAASAAVWAAAHFGFLVF
jgi:hypothetical protein